MYKNSNKLFTILILFLLSTNFLFAQNTGLKYLDDGGYSKIKNYISVDVVKIFGQSLSIRYERELGAFSLTGGVIIMNPSSNHKFLIDVFDIYDQGKRDFYPSKPGINPFVEANVFIKRSDNHNLSVGPGYRYYSYKTAKMQDIYISSNHIYKIDNNLFWTYGFELGVRLIKYNDIEYNPGNSVGLFLESYKDRYKDAVHKNAPIIRLNLGFGYIF